jgi:hypothetical protein
MKDDKECGCSKCKKYRKMMGVSECFGNKTDSIGIFEAFNFQKNKQFKVTFAEDVKVEWPKLMEKKEESPKSHLTPTDIEQRKDYMDILLPKMKDFKKRYGSRAKNVIAGIATKLAKRKPD